MKVYVDMDGVLADFFGDLAKLYSITVPHWKAIPPDEIEKIITSLIGSDHFERLDKFPTADTLIQRIVEKFGEYTILSAPMRGDYANSRVRKNKWLDREMKIQPAERIFESTKEKYAVDPTNGLPNILIDDKPSNIEAWIREGGYGIRYQADEDNVSDVVIEMEKYLDI